MGHRPFTSTASGTMTHLTSRPYSRQSSGSPRCLRRTQGFLVSCCSDDEPAYMYFSVPSDPTSLVFDNFEGTPLTTAPQAPSDRHEPVSTQTVTPGAITAFTLNFKSEKT